MAHEEKSRLTAKEYAKWHEQSVDIRNEMGLPHSRNPWTESKKVLRGMPRLDRMVDCVNVCFWAARQKHAELSEKELIDKLWMNPGASVSRLHFTLDDPGTWTHAATWYNYQKDCMLTSAAQLHLLGWPKDSTPYNTFSEADCRSLSGDAFSVPCAAMFSYIIYCNPWSPIWAPRKP